MDICVFCDRLQPDDEFGWVIIYTDPSKEKAAFFRVACPDCASSKCCGDMARLHGDYFPLFPS